MTSGKTTPGWPRWRRIRNEPCVQLPNIYLPLCQQASEYLYLYLYANSYDWSLSRTDLSRTCMTYHSCCDEHGGAMIILICRHMFCSDVGKPAASDPLRQLKTRLRGWSAPLPVAMCKSMATLPLSPSRCRLVLYIYIYIYTHTILSLSLSLYIYIYIYMCTHSFSSSVRGRLGAFRSSRRHPLGGTTCLALLV